VIEQKINLLV